MGEERERERGTEGKLLAGVRDLFPKVVVVKGQEDCWGN